MLEVTLGDLARQRAGSDDGKAYAAMLVEHHRRDAERLRWLVKGAGQSIPPERLATRTEREIMRETQQAVVRLHALEGAELDRVYLQLMVEGHEREVAKLGANVAKVANAPLEQLLQAARPMLQLHAKRARELRDDGPQALR